MQPIQMSQFVIESKPHPHKPGYLHVLVEYWTDEHGWMRSKVCGQYMPSSHAVAPIRRGLYGNPIYQ